MMFGQMKEEALRRVIKNAQEALENLKKKEEAKTLASKLFDLKIELEKVSDILRKKPRVFSLLCRSELPQLAFKLKESIGSFLGSAEKFEHAE